MEIIPSVWGLKRMMNDSIISEAFESQAFQIRLRVRYSTHLQMFSVRQSLTSVSDEYPINTVNEVHCPNNHCDNGLGRCACWLAKCALPAAEIKLFCWNTLSLPQFLHAWDIDTLTCKSEVNTSGLARGMCHRLDHERDNPSFPLYPQLHVDH